MIERDEGTEIWIESEQDEHVYIVVDKTMPRIHIMGDKYDKVITFRPRLKNRTLDQ